MKLFLAALLILAVFLSCGSSPSSGAQDTAFLPPLTELAAEEPPAEPPEPPLPDLPSAEPEFPELIIFLDPPPEEPPAQDYPEPELPVIPLSGLAQAPEELPAPEPPLEPEPLPELELPGAPPPPELAQVPEEPPPPEPEPLPPEPLPELVQAPEEPPSPEPVSEPSPEPEPPPPPPDPPPFIRPAETAAAPPAPRETLPVPVNPPSPVPARQPPSAAPPAPVDPPPPAPGQSGPDLRPVPASPESGDQISYSRTIRGTAGQLLEVPFRGTGWVYLGEADARRGVSYNTRRADADGQTFVFRLDKSGEYTLLFYKQDFIRDYILNDQVRVIVEDTPAQTSPYAGEPARLIAEPRWPPPETAAAAGQGGALPGAGPVTRQDDVSGETAATAGQGVALPEAAVAAGQGGATPAAAELRPEALTARAKEAYGAGQFPEALAALDEFQANFPLGSDEAWWLYGQLLEAAGPKRDIRGALEYYRRLIREYPQSPRCDDARKRIAYLERFYFNIR